MEQCPWRQYIWILLMSFGEFMMHFVLQETREITKEMQCGGKESS
jgi:hypothetical protein